MSHRIDVKCRSSGRAPQDGAGGVFHSSGQHLNMALAAPLGLRRASHDGWAKSQHAHWACTRTAEAVGVMLTHAFILDAANSDRERVETLEVDLPT